MIDLRSDTKTQPTPEMRAAIAAAEVGDEQRREDPTVNELERRVAERLGQEEAVFVPTATMANEIALRILAEPGSEVVAEENSHLFISELGGPAVHAGLMTRQLPCPNGRFTPDQLRATVRFGDNTHTPATRIMFPESRRPPPMLIVLPVLYLSLTGAANVCGAAAVFTTMLITGQPAC